MFQVDTYQLTRALPAQRSSRCGPFGGQCPEGHWWVKHVLSMDKLGYSKRTDHGEKEKPLPKIPIISRGAHPHKAKIHQETDQLLLLLLLHVHNLLHGPPGKIPPPPPSKPMSCACL